MAGQVQITNTGDQPFRIRRATGYQNTLQPGQTDTQDLQNSVLGSQLDIKLLESGAASTKSK